MSESNFNQGVFFSIENRTDIWTTPQDLFDSLNSRFHLDLDVCAERENTKCDRFYTVEQDGLIQPWNGRVWMNPPYGRAIAKWVEKAYTESKTNAEIVVCLVPARTCSDWWHRYCMKGEIWFIRNRLRFGVSKVNAPFPNAVVIFRKEDLAQTVIRAIDRHGNDLQ